MHHNCLRFLLLFMLPALLLPGCSSLQPTPPLNTPSPATPTPIKTPTLTSSPLPPTPLRVPVCTETTGSIVKDVIETKLLDKPLRYNIYLPPCYAYEKNKRYPVLYLLHGQNSDEDQWIRIGADSAADRIIKSGEFPAFIIVFPFDYSYKQPSEYKFEEVFIQQLIPRIDTSYRTLDDVTHRAIGGLSRGGAWALRMGTRYPHLFGAIGGHSPAIFLFDESSLTRRVLEIPPTKMPHIWLDVGNSDSEHGIIASFEKFLSKNNIPHEWHEYIGWHDEKYWSAHVEEYLRWYAAGWDKEVTG